MSKIKNYIKRNKIIYNLYKFLKNILKYLENILRFFQFPKKYKCPVCERKVYKYLPLPKIYSKMRKKYSCTSVTKSEMLNSKMYSCPWCGVSDRYRAYAIYMKKTFAFDKNMAILDIAPDKSFSKFIKSNYQNIKYYSADFLRKDVDYPGLDVTNMPQIPDKSIDFFICSHVLEHVFDDRAAMREFYRILSDDGCGILVVPINLNRTETDEDPNCTDVGERWRRFGQEDHVRAYAKIDWLNRLQEAGLFVYEYNKKDFGEAEMFSAGLSDTATIYIVRRCM